MGTALANNGDISIAFQTSGPADGEPLILITGITAQMLSWPQEFIDALVGLGFTVACFDNRDVGLSTHLTGIAPPSIGRVLLNHGSAPYRLEDMADDTLAVADKLGWDCPNVAGFSMGGTIAQTLAIRHPTRVRTLTSISSGPSPRLTRPSFKLTRAIARSGRRKAGNRAEQQDLSIGLYDLYRSPGFPTDEAWRRQVAGEEYDRSYDPDGPRRQAAATLASGSRVAALKNLTVPTLVLHGTADPMVPLKAGRATAAAVSGSRLLTYDGMGHELPSALRLPIAQAIAELAHANWD